MTYQISKDFTFSASHQLHGLAEDHPCSRVHGHNYVVRLTITADEVNPVGFIVDYNDLRPFGAWLDQMLDHRHLNDVLSFQPSAENMACHLTSMARELVGLPRHAHVSVAVSETPKTWAVYQP